MSGVVAFAGSRSAVPALVAPAVRSVVASGRSVVVGCAEGVDRAVAGAALAASPASLSVFAVAPAPAWRAVARWPAQAAHRGASVAWLPPVAGAASWALRTRSVVAAAVAGGPGSALVAVPSGACPPACVPGPLAAVVGGGSGTWLAVALAVSSSLPALVFLPAGVSAPAWPGGSWSPAASCGVWAGAVRWVPAPAQGRLPL